MNTHTQIYIHIHLHKHAHIHTNILIYTPIYNIHTHKYIFSDAHICDIEK